MSTQPLHLSPTGLNLIQEHEGCRLNAYLCPAFKVTIGYGHVILPKWDFKLFNRVSSETLGRMLSDCQTRRVMTQEAQVVLRINAQQARDLLSTDVNQIELFLNSVAQYGLNQNQFDALVSLVFNIGQGNFAISTLRKKLYAQDWAGAAAEFDKWIYTTRNGQKIKLDGLVNRRAAERALFEKPL
jgi:lysozyme